MPTPSRLVFVVAVLLAFASTHAKEVLSDYRYRASYFMVEDADDVAKLPACVSFSHLRVVDGRTEKTRIGTRRWEEGAGPTGNWGILLEGDIVPWVEDGVRQVGSKAGFRTGDPAGPSISVTLVKLELNEEKYDRSTWKSTVGLEVSLTRERATQSCFVVQVYGGSHNYGDSGKKINYDEVLNQALDRALIDLFANAAFADVACKSCRAPVAPPEGSPPATKSE